MSSSNWPHALSVAAAAGAGAAAGALAYAAYSQRRSRQADPAKAVEKAIVDRRSMFLGDLNGEAAPEDAIKRMLEAANWAPTHGKTEPWRFAVFRRELGQAEHFFKLQLSASEARLKEPDLSAEEEAALKKFISKQSKKAKGGPKYSHVIAISMKRQANPDKLMPEWEEIAAVSCAVQNAHIVGCQLGVAAYWTSGGVSGPLATAEVRKMLQLEDGDKCLGLLYVGKADPKAWEQNKSRASRGPISEKTLWF